MITARCSYCDREYMSCMCCNVEEDKPKYKENTNSKYVHEKWTLDKVKEELEKINKKYQILKLLMIFHFGLYLLQRSVK